MVKNILITGSGGFVGKNLTEYLADSYNLLTPRSFELNLLDEKSVCDYFKQNSIDLVIHCAKKGGERGVIDDQTTLDENMKMFQNLKSVLMDKKMIFLGSGAQYDKSRPLSKVKEEDLGKSIPKDHYGFSKYLIAKDIEQSKNILCLNIFGSYGKYEKSFRFPTYALSQCIKNSPIILEKNVKFDYLYIKDLSKIISYFIKNETKYKTVNVTPTMSITILELAEIAKKITNSKSEIIIKNDGMNNEYTGDNSRLLKILNSFEFSSYEYGMIELFKQLEKEHGNGIKNKI